MKKSLPRAGRDDSVYSAVMTFLQYRDVILYRVSQYLRYVRTSPHGSLVLGYFRRTGVLPIVGFFVPGRLVLGRLLPVEFELVLFGPLRFGLPSFD